MQILYCSLVSSLIFISMFSIFKKNKFSFNLSFECGFNFKKKIFNSYSMNMFNYSIMFMILDLEIIVVLPFTKINKMNSLSGLVFIFFLLLLVVMIKEWINNILQWTEWDFTLISNLNKKYLYIEKEIYNFYKI